MGEIFGAVGSIAGAAISASAIKSATKEQIKALERQRDFVYKELEPSKVSGAALEEDVARAKRQLALQAITDPELLRQRYRAQDIIGEQLEGFGAGSPAAQVGLVAAREGIKGVPGMEDAKKKLVDAALAELEAGATLPPDVQAELVKAGLERSGETTGAATGRGFGGQLLRQIIGSAGLQLKAERQERAAKLAESAQGLESERQRLLGTLFPNLSAVQLQQLQGPSAVLAQSQAMAPEAGLSGKDIANIWLARVGATNELAQSAANIGAAGGLGAAQAIQTGIGSAIPYGVSAINRYTSAPAKTPSSGQMGLYGGGSSYG